MRYLTYPWLTGVLLSILSIAFGIAATDVKQQAEVARVAVTELKSENAASRERDQRQDAVMMAVADAMNRRFDRVESQLDRLLAR